MIVHRSALLFALLSACSAHNLRRLQSNPEKYIVTLGDSFASGLGIHRRNTAYDQTFGASVVGDDGQTYLLSKAPYTCLRELDTTPGAKYAANNTDYQPLMVACANAETSHINSQFEYLQSLDDYADQVANDWEGSVIVVSAGGNDLRTGKNENIIAAIANCVFEFSPFTDCGDRSIDQISNIDTVQSRLVDLYTTITNGAGKAKIRVLGYPYIMQRNDGICIDLGFSSREADFVDANVDKLNNALEAAVASVKSSNSNVDIEYVDVQGYFSLGACENAGMPTEINGLVWDYSTGVSAASFHPTQLGYDAYYDALVDSLA